MYVCIIYIHIHIHIYVATPRRAKARLRRPERKKDGNQKSIRGTRGDKISRCLYVCIYDMYICIYNKYIYSHFAAREGAVEAP